MNVRINQNRFGCGVSRGLDGMGALRQSYDSRLSILNTGGRWIFLSGYINDTHTYVPGPDGKCGYGGKCFPKDVNAFAKLTENCSLGKLLAPLHDLNVHFRGFEEHI